MYRRAVRNTAAHFCGIGVQTLITLGLLLVATAYLAPADVGSYSLLLLTVTLAAYLVLTPANSALQRFYHAPDFQDHRDDLLGKLFILLVAKSLLLAALFLWFSTPLCLLLFGDLTRLPLVRLFAGLLLATPLPVLPVQVLVLSQRVRLSALTTLAGTAAGAATAIVLLVHSRTGVAALVYGQIVSYTVQTAIALPGYLKRARWRGSWNVLRRPLGWGYPQLPSAYSELAVNSGDRYLITLFMGVGAVGIYDLGYRLSSLVSIALIEPAKRGLLPMILKLESDPDSQRTFIARITTWFYCVGGLLALAVALFAKEVIQLAVRNPAFHGAWVIVPVIAFAYLQHGLGEFVGYGLVMRRRSRTIFTNLAICAAVNVVLNLLLIPLYGLHGAAAATLACYVVWNELKMWGSRREYDLRFDRGRLRRVTFVWWALAGSVLLLGQSWGLGVLVPVKAAALAAYPAALWLVGFFSQEDLATAREGVVKLRRDGWRATLEEWRRAA
jgi:O-antigen/teichoic acid export membrane protein